ncbi:Alpha/Beta hydrolase protein [Podospora australis]|uniref:Alpha/Beta hydrolase protein n=1 Tax=Podospora australis TaxID=1536484 RepID=A0AAN6WUM5_9PEZI|nr:Alpha/Beta hydrolase protein [Podospora australis]
MATCIATVRVDGVDIFYRSAGLPSSPTILLLHGYPTSSHMFRNLIPLLAMRYHVVAPDMPGFGFTTVSPERQYTYNFATLARTMAAFVEALSLRRFAIYVFDYGAPVGLRLALSRPDDVLAIITQNGNAYEAGLGHSFWDGVRKLWSKDSTQADEDALRPQLELPATRWQYTNGSPHPTTIPPEAYHLDQALLDRLGNKEIQLGLFRDYGNNVKLYPQFQEYFRRSKVPVLTAWGQHDEIFVPAGAEGFKDDVKNLEMRWLDAGHFALETNEVQMAEWIIGFLDKYNVFAE